MIMTQAEKILFVAGACMGTREGSSEHNTIISIYNQYPGKERAYKLTMSDPWCAAFVSAVFIAAGLDKLIPIECSCFYMKSRAERLGLIRDPKRYIPRPGDIIFYKWAGKNVVSHVGIVSSVKGSSLEVIEGNYNDKVGVRGIKLSYRYIDSYIEVPYAD